MRLKLAALLLKEALCCLADGRSRSKGNCCVIMDYRPLVLRRRASRPQLKRDSLGVIPLS